jgi:membrane-associated phospholipid phosphatase
MTREPGARFRAVARLRLPGALTCWLLGVGATIVIALSAWLATAPAAERAQTDLVLWFNDPPQPFATWFAFVNPLCRPVPLVLIAAVVIGWVLVTAAGSSVRWEMVRASLVAVGIAEAAAQLLKRVADQPRPTAIIPNLDTHGYPQDPHGNAYPSAHTAMLVAAVVALWPWMRWPQRVTGVIVAARVAANRIYIHGPHRRPHRRGLADRDPRAAVPSRSRARNWTSAT